GKRCAALRPRMGKKTKVQPRMVRCRRQCAMPAMTAERDSLAPWKKNSSTTVAVESQPTKVAAWPLAGRMVASPNVASSIRTKGSGRNFFNARELPLGAPGGGDWDDVRGHL